LTHVFHLVAGDILKEYISTPEIDNQILSLVNLRLLNLNEENEQINDVQYNTLELNSMYYYLITLLCTNIYCYHLLILIIITALTSRIQRLAVMVKYTTDIEQLFHKGLTKAEDNGILLETLKKRIIPLGQFIILFIIILYSTQSVYYIIYYYSLFFFFIIVFNIFIILLIIIQILLLGGTLPIL